MPFQWGPHHSIWADYYVYSEAESRRQEKQAFKKKKKYFLDGN